MPSSGGFIWEKYAEIHCNLLKECNKCSKLISRLIVCYKKLNWNLKFQFANFTSSFDNPLQE